MFLTSLCTPALIYMVFFLTHALIATFKDNYNHAILQLLIGILMNILLKLCVKIHRILMLYHY